MLRGDNAGMSKPKHCTKLGLDEEPLLSDLLDDPITKAVMARDRVTREELVAHIAEAQARLASVEA